MRTLKFRAWEGKEMFEPSQITFTDATYSVSNGRGVSIPFQPHITLMQGTGFIAKNGKTHLIGKEIYEGDIFRKRNDDDTEGYCVVMWLLQRGAFYMIDAVYYEILRDNDCSKEPEFSWLFDDAALYDFSIDCGLPIVGNVHQNPELLK